MFSFFQPKSSHVHNQKEPFLFFEKHSNFPRTSPNKYKRNCHVTKKKYTNKLNFLFRCQIIFQLYMTLLCVLFLFSDSRLFFVACRYKKLPDRYLTDVSGWQWKQSGNVFVVMNKELMWWWGWEEPVSSSLRTEWEKSIMKIYV